MILFTSPALNIIGIWWFPQIEVQSRVPLDENGKLRKYIWKPLFHIYLETAKVSWNNILSNFGHETLYLWKKMFLSSALLYSGKAPRQNRPIFSFLLWILASLEQAKQASQGRRKLQFWGLFCSSSSRTSSSSTTLRWVIIFKKMRCSFSTGRKKLRNQYDLCNTPLCGGQRCSTTKPKRWGKWVYDTTYLSIPKYLNFLLKGQLWFGLK